MSNGCAATRDFDIAGLSAELKRLRLSHAKVASKGEVTTTSNGDRVSLWWTMDVETGQATGFKTVGAPRSGDFLKLLKGRQAALAPPKLTPAAQPVRDARRLPAMESASQRFVIERSSATHPGYQSMRMHCSFPKIQASLPWPMV
jgi:type VI secretion system protein ImpM